MAALSPYIRSGEIAAGPDGAWEADTAEVAAARACLEAVLADPAADLPPAVVADVGRMKDRGWGVVEANAAWASGLCGCDPAAVLGVLRRAAVSKQEASAEDRRWARAMLAAQT